MASVKPGELLTYSAEGETRTGVVLDRAPGPSTYWVHREGGTFDMVRIVTHGRRRGETTFHGHYTAAGEYIEYIESPIRSAESA